MKDLLKKLKERLADEETVRYLKFMTIPFVVVVLVFAVVVSDGSDTGNEMKASDISGEGMDPAKNTQEDGKGISLRTEKAGDEIYNLMASYFEARKTCDINGLSQVFGNAVSVLDMEEENRRMEEEVKYYQDYQNLVCYSAKGLKEGSLVVYSCFSIKFRQSDTLAPSMFSCYVKCGEDESWHIEPKPSKEEAAYMEKVNRSDAVQAMADQVNSELRSALEGDSNLLSVYNTLMGNKGGKADGDGRAYGSLASDSVSND